jgi:predicted SprT family Zn-dependent metalloprotease
MRNIEEVVYNCCKKLDAIGIEHGIIVAVSINTRAKNRWGQCKRRSDGRYEINISSRLMSENVDLIHLETTVIHEILHTCAGCMNHGKMWKALAEKVNREYGYNIKRATSSEEKGIEPVQTVRVIRYKFVCVGCGGIIERQRSSNFTKHPERFRCGKCHCRLQRVF